MTTPIEVMDFPEIIKDVSPNDVFEETTLTQESQEISEIPELQPIEPTEPKPEITSELTQETPELPENLESLKIETNEEADPDPIQQNEQEFQINVEPPTPDIVREMQLSKQSSEEAVLTKICSSESEQEAEVMSTDKIVESRPSMIPVLESNNKSKTGEQTDSVFKRPKPILKEKDSKIYTNIIPDEQTHSTFEEINSPDDENAEFVGLGLNTPLPVRASSPNPFGKKRRRGKKGKGYRK